MTGSVALDPVGAADVVPLLGLVGSEGNGVPIRLGPTMSYDPLINSMAMTARLPHIALPSLMVTIEGNIATLSHWRLGGCGVCARVCSALASG